MSVFVFKALSVLIKTTARPLVSWFSYYNTQMIKESSHHEYKILKKSLINIGQSYNYYYTKFNRRSLGTQKYEPIKLLSNEQAFEKAAEFLTEIFVYSILIIIPILEYRRNNNLKKMKKLNEMSVLLKLNSKLELELERNLIEKNKIKEIEENTNKLYIIKQMQLIKKI